MTTHDAPPVVECAFSGSLRDRLVAAILDGTKTSTSSTLLEYSTEKDLLPVIGARQTVVDSHNSAVAIIQTVAVEIIRLADVSIAHALRGKDSSPSPPGAPGRMHSGTAPSYGRTSRTRPSRSMTTRSWCWNGFR